MPNIAALLKSEISRVARKEIKTQVDALTHAARASRREVVALKRRVLELERKLARSERTVSKLLPRPMEAEPAGGKGPRVTAKGLGSLRRRLDLSAADFGRLVGASGLSVYVGHGGTSRGAGDHRQPRRLASDHGACNPGRAGNRMPSWPGNH